MVDPAVRIYYTRADTLIARIGVGVPPFDIAFLQVPQAGVEVPGQTEPGRMPLLTRSIPNPFRTSTSIAFSLNGPSRRMRLDIYDTRGRRVTTLLDTAMPAGTHAVTWDGTDFLGGPVADGVYFYHLRSDDVPGGGSSTGRMILLR